MICNGLLLNGRVLLRVLSSLVAIKSTKGECCSFKNAEDGNIIEAMSHTKAFYAPGANAPEFPL
eukprot:scaffold4657_cov140-Skeletonema_marinoi.AAC.3